MAVHNAAVIKMVTDRFSAHIRSFNHLPVSEEDSDRQYWLCREKADLATASFTRAPEFKPSGIRMALMPSADLGNAYRAMHAHFTEEERARYAAIEEELDAFTTKYEG